VELGIQEVGEGQGSLVEVEQDNREEACMEVEDASCLV